MLSFFQKYGDIKVKFASYHKYVFKFKGVTEEGDTLKILAGGDYGMIFIELILKRIIILYVILMML